MRRPRCASGTTATRACSRLVRVGNRSRTITFECVVQCRDAKVLDPPVVAVTATGTVVVP